jgi:two-component system, cell cycle response regulator DivK
MSRPLILVIEDNEQNLYLMRFLLEKNGFEVIEARDGMAGLELAKQRVPAAILLDIQLPIMSGYTVAAELRKIEALARVPIIAVTSFAMVGDRERCLAAGATDYVEKPIDPEGFLKRLRQQVPG